jgi:hypothetical protein
MTKEEQKQHLIDMMRYDENLGLYKETEQMNVGGVISRFFRWFKISCPKCKKGKLTQDEIHHCSGGGELNVYSCDNCQSKFV